VFLSSSPLKFKSGLPGGAKASISLLLTAGLAFSVLTVPSANASDLAVSLVKNINQTTKGSFEQQRPGSAVIGEILYFDLKEFGNSKGIWRSDGTEEGTTLVKMLPTELNQQYALHAMGDKLFFQADEGIFGRELWISDGTPEGTELLKDINFGPGHSSPYGFTEIDGTLYFFASSNGIQADIWKTDGTPEGTLLHRTNIGEYPQELTALGRGETLLFRAQDETSGSEVWTTDGPSGATALLKDINPSTSGFSWTRGSAPGDFTQVILDSDDGGTIFFSAGTGSNRELWKSDGTTEGTIYVKEIHPSSSSNPSYLTAVGNTLFFSADDGSNGTELWKSNGTADETVMVKNINNTSADSIGPGIVKHPTLNEVYFSANDGVNGTQLWRSDGTSVGTTIISDVPEEDFNQLWLDDAKFIGSTLLFLASSEDTDGNLWKSDGTLAGTQPVKPRTIDDDGWAEIINVTPTKLFLNIRTPEFGAELWASNGTPAGTELVRDINLEENDGVGSSSGVVVGSTYFFKANDGIHGSELWKSDGTEFGTVMVKDISPGNEESSLSNLTVFNGTLYFTADDGEHGEELWKSIGTEAGTVMLMDIWEEDDDSEPDDLTVVGNTLYFTADDGDNGRELWKSDGTTTVMVKNINEEEDEGSDPDNLIAVGSTLYFTADDGENGRELWMSSSTTTVMVKNINEEEDEGSDPDNLIAVGSNLYFLVDDGDGFELWKSDGTPDNTAPIDLGLGSAASPDDGEFYAVAVGDNLYFTAETDAEGVELWMISAAGVTSMVKDIWTGAQGSYPYLLTAFGSDLYFVASDDENSYELWKSDGTPGGTIMVKDINPSSDSYPEYLTVFAGSLYFAADDGVAGYELWKSDGTPSGTVRVGEINPSSYLVASTTTLFFSANNGTFGTELWKLGPATVTELPPRGPRVSIVQPIETVNDSGQPRIVKKSTIRKAASGLSARLLGKSLSKDVLFVADSTRLSSAAKKSLRQAARAAKASAGKVAVTGFAAMSGRGSEYEKSVSQKRALAVARYLRAQGFDGWIYYQGLSGRQGLAFEGNPRRVEIRILK
jgi:trimeric autotransporter adhesin